MQFCKCVGILGLSLDVFFFFFKQKTAYEMRISDWSSDVCSSDLLGLRGVGFHRLLVRLRGLLGGGCPVCLGRRRGDGVEILAGVASDAEQEIGRASRRERVCQYV